MRLLFIFTVKCFLIFLITITLWSLVSTPPAYAQGPCYINLNGSETNSTDATALQTAVITATPGNIIKVAGTCTGVQNINSLVQTVYISKNLTIQGGYTTTNWTVSDPDTNPTTLDAVGSGRVVYQQVLQLHSMV